MTKLTPQELDERIEELTLRMWLFEDPKHPGVKKLVKQFIPGVIEAITPERKPHYKGAEAGGYSGNETSELIYSSGKVDAIDAIQANTKELLG